ncbi:MAG: NACHT domain-containing protein [Ardenticatenaceae bacterium]|nr:NACHT domain-containing protein [Ardenticatenaceae bacterium]
MTTFGQQLRVYRRQCRDPLRGGIMTQARLGELLGDELDHAGYSGAAVSDWERGKSKIHADDRLALVGLVAALHRCGGLNTLAEANHLLRAGNYRALDVQEQSRIFPDSVPQPAPATAPLKPAAVLTPERRKQLILLEKVKQFWVEGVLEKSVRGAMLLNLDGRSYDEAVANPWQQVIGAVPPLPLGGATAVPPPNLTARFHQADRALLILGEPGSGKTITLITLTQELIAQAEVDPQQPIPVIFNLISWAEKRESISAWLEEELTAKYQIPHTLGRQWLADDALILLLDGLDEVALNHRAACVAAINQFRKERGLTGIVVSSRHKAYQALNTNLQLNSAFLLNPLTKSQIDHYLAAAGEPLDGLRTAVHQDPVLQEMAQTPLMLHALSAAYWQTKTLPGSDGEFDLTGLFDTYTKAMFDRRGENLAFSHEKVMERLAWLAQRMDKHNQALFLIERLQPSWLPSYGWKWVYILGSRLFAGLISSIMMWLYWLIIRINVPPFGTEWSQKVARVIPGRAAETDWWLMLFLGLSMGLLTAVFDALYYKWIADRGYPPVDKTKQLVGRIAFVGIVTGALATLFVSIYDNFYIAFSSGLVVAIAFGLNIYFVYGSNLRNDIRTVAALSWTWLGALIGLLIGLGIATTIEFVEWVLYGTSQLIPTYISLGLMFMLLGGLRGNRVSITSNPNQGIWLSATNSLIACNIVAFTMMAAMTVVWQNFRLGLVAGILSTVSIFFMFGGGNVANHFYLRLLLWLTKDLSWDLVSFLEFSVNRVFLHRVGGGYLFTHQTLQNYFAAHVTKS